MKARSRVIVVLLAAAVMPQAYAGVNVLDEWAGSGAVTVSGQGWQAIFRRGESEIALTAQDQTVSLTVLGIEEAPPTGLVSCEAAATFLQQKAEVRAVFAAGNREFEASLLFNSLGMVCVRAGDGIRGVRLSAPMAIGVLPGIRLEDVLYRPADYPERSEITIPAENWFMGLLAGENGILACAWPDGAQSVRLRLGGAGEERRFESLELTTDGKDLYIEVLSGPGIWHRETLKPEHLERDYAPSWKPPYPVTYKTQAAVRGETTTVRTFKTAEGRNGHYRPEVGSFVVPVWREGGRILFHYSKKVPPKGETVLYPIEGGDATLMGFLQQTPVYDLLDARNTRSPLPHGPRDIPNGGYVACGGTTVMRTGVFAHAVQQRDKEFLKQYADFLADYVAIVQQKNMAYFAFLAAIREKLETWLSQTNDVPEVRAYLESMRQRADQTEEAHRRKMELFGENTPEAHIARADRNAIRLKELIDLGSPEFIAECDHLVDVFNELSWAHDEVTGMRFSLMARAWAQEAALACAEVPGAIEHAQVIRAAIRDALNGAPPW